MKSQSLVLRVSSKLVVTMRCVRFAETGHTVIRVCVSGGWKGAPVASVMRRLHEGCHTLRVSSNLLVTMRCGSKE